MATTPDLCNKCHTIISNLETLGIWRTIPHQDSLGALQSSSEQGCRICNWIVLDLDRSLKSDRDVEQSIKAGGRVNTEAQVTEKAGWYNPYRRRRDVSADPVKDRMILDFTLRVDGHRFWTSQCKVLFNLEPNVDLSIRSEPSRDSGKDVALALARAWLHKCRTTHSICQQARYQSRPPTRLLELSTDSTGVDLLTLREASTGAYSKETQYVTLSHRWAVGEEEVLSDTKIQQYRSGFPLRHLKRSIQDAVKIARDLNIDFLWVDSLCIKQDDAAEVKREIGQMAEVYGNAVCNIAAADAEARDEGCFWQRSPSHAQTFVVSLPETPSYPAQRHRVRRDWSHIQRRLKYSGLRRRAWVFQEIILAPRVLYFCKDETYWECKTIEACETFPDGKAPYSDTPTSWWEPGRWHGPSVKTMLLGNTAENANQAHAWVQAISEYTGLRLTFPEDKMKALEGIVSIWYTLHGERAIYGFLPSRLPRDLLWYASTKHGEIEGSHITRRISRPHRPAPTWSWASVDGPIGFKSDDGSGRHIVQVIDIAPSSCNNLHNLQLRGRPVSARLVSHESDPTEHTGRARLILPKNGQHDTVPDTPYFSNQEYAILDDPTEMTSENIVCLPTFQSTMLGREFIGLVLAKAKSANETEGSRYKRIGAFFSKNMLQYEGVEERTFSIC